MRIDAAVSAELEHIWSRVQAELAIAVDEPTYRIWLGPLRARSFADGRLSIEAPEHSCEWIRGRFGHVLEAGVAVVLGPEVIVELIGACDSSAGSTAAASAQPHAHPSSRRTHRSG